MHSIGRDQRKQKHIFGEILLLVQGPWKNFNFEGTQEGKCPYLTNAKTSLLIRGFILHELGGSCSWCHRLDHSLML